MIICMDCDGVLNNLQEAVIKIFNERYGKKYTLDDFKNFNISECLDKEEAINFVAIYNEQGVYDSVKPLYGAQNAVKRLIRAGHEIYVVTDAAPCIFEEKTNWIKYNFPEIDDAHIICMKHKWLFKCNVMIDDNLDNLLNGYHYDRICFDYPWNKSVRDEVYGIHRVSNWNSAVSAIANINKEWSDVAV